ncbi:hypothetical protein ACEE31_12465, partial [Staphylococcus simulans]
LKKIKWQKLKMIKKKIAKIKSKKNFNIIKEKDKPLLEKQQNDKVVEKMEEVKKKSINNEDRNTWFRYRGLIES